MATAPRTQRGRQAQKGRWNAKIHGSYLKTLFEKGAADYKVFDKEKALKVREEYKEMFGNFKDTNFWNNYKATATDYILKMAQPSRDSGSYAGSDDEGNGMEFDAEYEDDFEGDEYDGGGDDAGGGSPQQKGRFQQQAMNRRQLKAVTVPHFFRAHTNCIASCTHTFIYSLALFVNKKALRTSAGRSVSCLEIRP